MPELSAGVGCCCVNDWYMLDSSPLDATVLCYRTTRMTNAKTRVDCCPNRVLNEF